MTTHKIVRNAGTFSLKDLRGIYEKPTHLQLDAGGDDGIAAARQTVTDLIERGDTAYGINTGFGLMANTHIKAEDVQTLQKNLVFLHL